MTIDQHVGQKESCPVTTCPSIRWLSWVEKFGRSFNGPTWARMSGHEQTVTDATSAGLAMAAMIESDQITTDDAVVVLVEVVILGGCRE